jgi:hypothetical protein
MSLLGVEDRLGNMWFLCTHNVGPPFQHKGLWWYKIAVDMGPVMCDDGTITLPIFTEWWPTNTDPLMFQEGGVGTPGSEYNGQAI